MKPPSQAPVLSWPGIIDKFQGQMAKSIHCSNAIENVGRSWKITEWFCKIVFTGDWPSIDHIDERDVYYANEIAMLAATTRGTDKLSIIRSRREIVQHAVAMKFLFGLLVVENYPLDEAIIKYTHRLVMELSEHEETSGVYRESNEAATYGARFETDLEYERQVRDAKRLKPNGPPPQRMIKTLLLLKICSWCISPNL
jgi:hypothetical protein